MDLKRGPGGSADNLVRLVSVRPNHYFRCGKKTAWGDAGVHMVGHIHQQFNTRLAARSLGARKPIKCAFRPIVIRQVHFDT